MIDASATAELPDAAPAASTSAPIRGNGWTLHRLGLLTAEADLSFDYEDEDPYQVLTKPDARPELLASVQTELLGARKNPHGLTSEYMARCPVLLELLGVDDPKVARAMVTGQLLALEVSEPGNLALMAASYSLGLADESDTHLNRLVAFGELHGYDQRQARRYSDRGIRQLAAVLTARPLNSARSNADIFVRWDDADEGPATHGYAIGVTTHHHWFVKMEELTFNIGADRVNQRLVPLDYQPERRGLWIVNRYEGLFLADISAPVVVTIRWHGELWPKYTTLIANDNAPGSVVTEVVGDRCAVVLRV